jgi:eukaryotic-like serine/threonine-protein kinase
MGHPQLEGYSIKQAFAAGGMAKIYDATQTSLNRPVAIKFLSRQLLSHPEAQSLFESESLIIAQLNHPNIVNIIDKGITEDEQPYFVMEKINGIDLANMLSQGELPLGKKFDIAIQLCKGLAYAHKNAVIHRDIKPSNIIIDQQGFVKILDFGIALTQVSSNQVITDNMSQPDHSSDSSSSVMGTQGYVAPEQQQDYSKATIASDIYSVGVLFYELFGSAIDSDDKIADERLTDLPNDLAALIKKCCHSEPSHRYKSLTQVRDDLLKISQGSHLGKTHLQQVTQENKDLASNFNLLDVLSKHQNKRVFLFQKKSNRQLLVIKRISGDSRGIKQAKYLASLKHPNIVKIFAAVKSHNNNTVISEYLSGGSLSNQMIQNISEQDFLLQACQICSAIQFAHQNNILHSNLAPNNILFDANQNIKVADFGQINCYNDDPQTSKNYQPPAQQGFSEQYDIYCMGAIFYHMLYGVLPNSKPQANQRKLSFRLNKLIEQMIALDPVNRPRSAQQVLIELQRIASADNKQRRSNIGKPLEKKKVVKKVKTKQVQVQSNNQVIGLSIALAIAVLCIIGLLIKDIIT